MILLECKNFPNCYNQYSLGIGIGRYISFVNKENDLSLSLSVDTNFFIHKKTVLTIKKQLKFHSSWLLFFWFEDVYIHSISSRVKSLVSGMMKKQTMATKILTQEYM